MQKNPFLADVLKDVGLINDASELVGWWEQRVKQVVKLPQADRSARATRVDFIVLTHTGQIFHVQAGRADEPPCREIILPESTHATTASSSSSSPSASLSPSTSSQATEVFPFILPGLPGSRHSDSVCIAIGTSTGHVHIFHASTLQKPLFSTQIHTTPVLRFRQHGIESSLANPSSDGFLLVLFEGNLLLMMDLDALCLTLRIALSRETNPDLDPSDGHADSGSQVKSWQWHVSDQETLADLLPIPPIRPSLALVSLTTDPFLFQMAEELHQSEEREKPSNKKNRGNETEEADDDDDNEEEEPETAQQRVSQYHSSSTPVESEFLPSPSALSVADPSPPSLETFLVVGGDPMLGILELDKLKAKPFISAALNRVTQVATKLFAFARSWWSSAPPVEEERPVVKREPPPEAHLRFALADSPRRITSIVAAPSHSLVALTDTLGRVLVFDHRDAIIVRVFKGYRSAQCTWLVKDDVLFLVIYAPRRAGLLEVWEMRHSARRCALQLGSSCHSLHVDGASVPYLFDPTAATLFTPLAEFLGDF